MTKKNQINTLVRTCTHTHTHCLLGDLKFVHMVLNVAHFHRWLTILHSRISVCCLEWILISIVFMRVSFCIVIMRECHVIRTHIYMYRYQIRWIHQIYQRLITTTTCFFFSLYIYRIGFAVRQSSHVMQVYTHITLCGKDLLTTKNKLFSLVW